MKIIRTFFTLKIVLDNEYMEKTWNFDDREEMEYENENNEWYNTKKTLSLMGGRGYRFYITKPRNEKISPSRSNNLTSFPSCVPYKIIYKWSPHESSVHFEPSHSPTKFYIYIYIQDYLQLSIYLSPLMFSVSNSKNWL